MSEKDPTHERESRRGFLTQIARAGAALAIGGAAWLALTRKRPAADDSRMVWQIDPFTCTQCGRCATECVLSLSAVKCVHDLDLCGYCDYCTGFHSPKVTAIDAELENQLCPVGAIVRKYVEAPYYEYTIDEPKCNGCGICVGGCTDYGNGSLYLQVRHDRCLNCNDCLIAQNCPSDAYVRVPASDPYVSKKEKKAR